MQKYIIRIVDKYDNVHFMVIFDEMKPGDKIGWGADSSEPDGIRYWTVTKCEKVGEGRP